MPCTLLSCIRSSEQCTRKRGLIKMPTVFLRRPDRPQARVAGGAMAAASGILLDALSSGAINLGAAGLEWVFLAGIAGTLAVRRCRSSGRETSTSCGHSVGSPEHQNLVLLLTLFCMFAPGCLCALAAEVEA